MSPALIEPYTVDLVLQYIVPASLQPLPSHLLSKLLLQRHHFLDIAATNSVEYLCWSPHVQSKVFDILELLNADDSHHRYQFRYTFDGDFAYAHVHVTSSRDPGLRLVFQWDVSDEEWKFHDLSVMPFPPDAKNSPQESSDSNPNEKALGETPSLILSLDSPTTNDDDDAYWDAYGANDEMNRDAHDSAHIMENSSEDAYWAQYASVHGSADSTQSSPLPSHGRTQSYFMEDANSNDPTDPHNRTVSIPISKLHPGRQPSPGALLHLLSSISPRESSSHTPISGSPSAEYECASEREITLVSQSKDLEVDSSPKLNSSSSFRHRSSEESLLLLVNSDEAEAALKNAISGVYRLWKMHKSNDDKESFMQVVWQSINDK